MQGTLPPSYIIQAAPTVSAYAAGVSSSCYCFLRSNESPTAAAVDSMKCQISLHLLLMTAADAYSRTFIAVRSCKCCSLQLALLTAADAGVHTVAATDARVRFSCRCRQLQMLSPTGASVDSCRSLDPPLTTAAA
jgi:hypothetical protein